MRTTSDCKLIEIPISKLKKYSRLHPKLYEVYIKSINSRLSSMTGQFYNIAFNNSAEKIASILYNSAIYYNIDSENIELPYVLTHHNLSNLTNCSRTTVTCFLNELITNEIVELNKDKLIIKDINQLKKFLIYVRTVIGIDPPILIKNPLNY